MNAQTLTDFVNWTNVNSGFLSLILFVLTLVIALFGGLFRAIRQRPKFKIKLLNQCSYGAVFDMKREHEGYPVTKTAIVLYLEITNVGNAASSIGDIRVGYKKADLLPPFLSKRNWIQESTSKADFRVDFKNSNHSKVYPFLKQRSLTMPVHKETFLSVGRSESGVVYFEQPESFGNAMPRVMENNTMDLLVEIEDAFRGKHRKRVIVDSVDAQLAFSYNPFFGQTQFLFEGTSEPDSAENS